MRGIPGATSIPGTARIDPSTGALSLAISIKTVIDDDLNDEAFHPVDGGVEPPATQTLSTP